MMLNDVSTYLIVISGLLLTIGYLSYNLMQKKRNNAANSYEATAMPNFFVSQEDGSSIEVREISRIPGTGLLVPNKGLGDQTSKDVQAVNQAGSLVENLFKGTVSTPGKTLEVVFKPHIQAGMNSGSYKLMKTTSGETLCDAVDSSNRVVGKGRLIETGRAKQLIGASYQLLSIAVAQSHLAEINHSLSKIEDLIRDVLNNLEDKEQGQIKGDIETLKLMAEKMRKMENANLSSEQSQSLQDISRSFNQYQETILRNFDTHIENINKQTSKDSFGSDKTFWELKEKIEGSRLLLHRYDLLLQLSAIHKMVSVWCDPNGTRFSPCNVKSMEWRDRIRMFKSATNSKIDEFFKNVTFNTQEQLRLYREILLHISVESGRVIEENLEAYEILIVKIEERLQQITTNGEIRLAVSFDDEGKTKKIAII